MEEMFWSVVVILLGWIKLDIKRVENKIDGHTEMHLKESLNARRYPVRD